MKRVLGSVAAVAALLCATQASAAIMLATLTGGWNANPLYESWSTTVIYDTARGDLSSVPGGEVLNWDSTSGAPSPILSLRGILKARTTPLFPGDSLAHDVTFSMDDATSFKVTHTAEQYLFSATRGAEVFRAGFDLTDAGGWLPLTTAPYNLQDVFSSPLIAQYALFGATSSVLPGAPPIPDMQSLSVSQAVLGVPEPSIWAVMLMGFFSLGGALRLDRKARGLRLGMARG